jgi:hypothetical protein
MAPSRLVELIKYLEGFKNLDGERNLTFNYFRSPVPSSNLVRPGTYKKSAVSGSSPTFDPSREDLIAIIERDVAFSLIENRRKLMEFLKDLTQVN